MITEMNVRETLKSEIATKMEMPAESIDEDAFLADLGLDSLQALQLLVTLERGYHILIGEEDLKHFKTINSLTKFVMQKISETSTTQAAAT